MDVNNEENNLSSNISFNSNLEVDFLEDKIERLKVDLMSEKRMKIAIFIVFLIPTVIGVLGIFKVISLANYISIPLSIASFILVLASFSDQKKQQLLLEIKSLEKQKQRKETINPLTKTSRYFDDLVSINLRNLEEYYEIVKNSNKKSFNASFLISIFGILIISSGLIGSYFSIEFKDISYMVTGSGILVEAISGLMFYLYNKTVLQLKGYHDSLLNVQNILLCFKLIEDTDDDESRSATMKQMIEFLIVKKENN